MCQEYMFCTKHCFQGILPSFWISLLIFTLYPGVGDNCNPLGFQHTSESSCISKILKLLLSQLVYELSCEDKKNPQPNP